MNLADHLPFNARGKLPASTRDALNSEGAIAKGLGLPRDACPRFAHDSMRAAWLEGYDAAPGPEPMLKRFETGGPLLGGGL